VAAVTLTPFDLAPFAVISEDKAFAMIEDALAISARIAPCILEAEFSYAAAAKAVLRGAILRWNEAGTGALSAESAGPFSGTIDTRQPRRNLFWPSEITQLQDMCKGDETSGAFQIDTVSVVGSGHADICALNFGGLYCSCGAVLTNLLYPLYEVGPDGW
jgi:hypothetical protein